MRGKELEEFVELHNQLEIVMTKKNDYEGTVEEF